MFKFFRTENNSQEAHITRRTLSWYIIKMSRYFLLTGIGISLTLNIYFCGIHDDFIDAFDSNATKVTTASAHKRSAPATGSLMEYPSSYTLRVRRNPGDKTSLEDDEDKGGTRLSDLMCIFPAIAAAGLISGMEACGQAFRDPLSKWTTVILDVICSLLAVDLFTFSLLSVMRHTHMTMVMVCILSMLLFVMHITDIVHVIAQRMA